MLMKLLAINHKMHTKFNTFLNKASSLVKVFIYAKLHSMLVLVGLFRYYFKTIFSKKNFIWPLECFVVGCSYLSYELESIKLFKVQKYC